MDERHTQRTSRRTDGLLQRTLHAWLKTDPGALALIQAAPLPIILAHPDGRIDTMNGPALGASATTPARLRDSRSPC